jgi:ubiquitin-like modifier-activating enzyme ATG7
MLMQFQPFVSSPALTFWITLNRLKLNKYMLNDVPIPITGYFSGATHADSPGSLSLHEDSFEPPHHAMLSQVCVPGLLLNFNTSEEFKLADKNALLRNTALQIWVDIVSGKALEDPATLGRILVVSFADLKAFRYVYWFAFPVVAPPTQALPVLVHKPILLSSILTSSELACLSVQVGASAQKYAFWIEIAQSSSPAADSGAISDSRKIALHGLNALSPSSPLSLRIAGGQSELLLGFSDPSNALDHPGWPLRNILLCISYHFPAQFTAEPLRVVCYRSLKTLPALVLTVHLPPLFQSKPASPSLSWPEDFKSLGWERDGEGRLAPRAVELKRFLDETALAVSAADLNLNLMRWRALPELNIDALSRSRCLLLGAGTLGCNVARNLLAWGVRHLTFVDSGRVSYSNPLRQSLFTLRDCKDGGAPKAEAAAAAVALLAADVTARGVALSIPMPGHPLPEGERAQTAAAVRTLSELIQTHDAVFLLTDSRESRWLPTILCCAMDKPLLNAALGLDSLLVLRHGTRHCCSDPRSLDLESADGKRLVNSLDGADEVAARDLGCYFCSDVVAPGDSSRDRTLDQMCTVRAGQEGVEGCMNAKLITYMAITIAAFSFCLLSCVHVCR